jgi:chromosome segregation ATPase
VASRGDSWESLGSEAAWQQPEADADREQVLRLARRLAEAHERQNAEALVQVEDLKRALRERAADVSRRELEVERRTKELDQLTGRGPESRRLRLRRPEVRQDADEAYAEELLSRREAELQKRLEVFAPRERDLNEREAALRARELEVEEWEAALASREQEVAEAKASLDRRKTELQSSYARLRANEASFAAKQAELREQRGLVEADRAEAPRTTDGASEREVALEAQALELRKRAELEAQLETRETALLAGEAELLRVQAGLASQQESIRRRERELDDLERLQERERAVPAVPYVTFTEGLDAFTGGRSRSG